MRTIIASIVLGLVVAFGLAYSLASADAARVGQSISARDAVIASILGE